MPRKSVARVPDSNPPEYQCCTCWYYEPKEIDFGACFGYPPQCVADDAGNPTFFRVHVNAEDRGCPMWKPRQGVH